MHKYPAPFFVFYFPFFRNERFFKRTPAKHITLNRERETGSKVEKIQLIIITISRVFRQETKLTK